ncbi:MAG TPA: type II secretion system protein GspM [Burkholderiaceae bacterium]|nr:type II secretion system protein GspM [Burkholderiaceae bacterium]
MTGSERLSQWWDRRKSRERLLVIAVATLAVLLASDALLLKPVRIQLADSNKRLAAARSELDKLQQLVEQRDRIGSERLRQRQDALQARLSAAESEIRRAQIDLVAPPDMARQLTAILHKFPQLRVVGMASEPPLPVDEGADQSGKVPVNAEARRSMLYEHGLELTVEGRYLDLIAYLQQLEHTPYKIYWRDLELKVNSQGVPVTKVRFFTLSRGPTWLTL